MPRTKQVIPANETPAQRFIRLANVRVNNVLTNLKSLSQLSGANYVSTPVQRKQIQQALVDATNRALTILEKGETAQEFKLMSDGAGKENR